MRVGAIFASIGTREVMGREGFSGRIVERLMRERPP